MSADDLHGILDLVRAAERLKTVTRSGWTSAGEPESVAEHTWRPWLLAPLPAALRDEVAALWDEYEAARSPAARCRAAAAARLGVAVPDAGQRVHLDRA